MATIGYFKKNGASDFIGDIVTLGLRCAGVKIVSVDTDNDKAPTHRVYVGRAEIGAGWLKDFGADGKEYVSFKLDDPSFDAPIYASLFEDDDGEGYSLVWSRPRKNGI